MNWAIRQFKKFGKVFAIPGNHDLPHHNYKDVSKSAYWTLVEAGVIQNLVPGTYVMVNQIHEVCLWPFPCGFEVVPRPTPKKPLGADVLHVAAVHEYIWMEEHGYPGAPEEMNVKAYSPKLKGYDAALFGDNHKGFAVQRGECHLLNSGGFMRRKSDEADYQPTVGLLSGEGIWTRVPLNVADDKFAFDLTKLPPHEVANLEGFVSMLSSLGDTVVDFGSAIAQYMARNNIPDDVKEIIIASMEK